MSAPLPAIRQRDRSKRSAARVWVAPDGAWTEEPFTGTGFPRVFYLKYHMYRLYFPIIALARYKRALMGKKDSIGNPANVNYAWPTPLPMAQ